MSILTLIIVESTKSGVDKKLIQGILESNGFDLGNFEIKTTEKKKISSGSKTDVLKYLTNQLYSDGKIDWNNIQNVLIIVDADEEPKKSFQEIINALEKNDSKNNFNIPDSLNKIKKEDNKKINVGIFLFPDCKNKGSLETLCLKALKHDKKEEKLKCIENYFNCLESKGIDINKKTEDNKSKSKFRIFMSTPNPDRYVDSVIDCIDLNSNVFNKVAEFVKEVNE